MTHSRRGRELLTSHGLAPRRDLGQNFVADPNTVRRIAHLAGVGPGDHVVEIGAGLGSLTLALAETGATVTAVEVDRGLAGVLRDVVAGVANVTVVERDAMTLDWPALLGAADRWVLVANLPYNVATPLVCDLLDGVPPIERMLVMVQREVGERLVAAPRSAAYGAVSVKVAYWASARDRRSRAGGGLHAQAERRVGARRDRAPAAARRRARGAVHARAHGVRATPQDAAPVARRRRRCRDVRRRRCRRDGASRGARPRRLGPADARGECRHDRRAGPGEADADVADHRRPRRRLPPARRRDGVARPRRRGDDRPVRHRRLGQRAVRARRARRRIEPRHPGLAALRPWRRPCTSTSRSPTGAVSVAARPTPRRSCAGPGTRTSARRRGSAPTSRSAWSAAAPASGGSARSSSRRGTSRSTSRSSCRHCT